MKSAKARAAEQRSPAGPLHDKERGGEKCVAAKGEDRRRGMDRPKTTEGGPGQAEIELGKSELKRNDHTDRKCDHAPEDRRQGEFANDLFVIEINWALQSGGCHQIDS